eukprot:tig00001286_g8022.t1
MTNVDLANAAKAKGNEAFSAQRFDEAVQHFSEAIQHDPSNHVLYSNRSAAYAGLNKFKEALGDAEKCCSIKPDWAKGYSRKGLAHYKLGEYKDAVKAYKEGLKHDPSNAQLQEGLQEAEDALMGGTDMGATFANMFQGDLFGKIAANPQLAKHLADPSFRAAVEDLQRDPKNLGKHLQDPRILQLLSSLMGVKVTTADPSGNFDAMEEEAPAPPPRHASPPKPRAPEKKEPEAPVDPKKKEALEEKEKGNAAYKARRFEEALAHYSKAIELDDAEMSFLTNRAAVHFETGNYEACVADCLTAVDVGRSHRADFKNIAKALARIGTARQKQDNLEEAIKYYEKSLSEHKADDVYKKLQEVKRIKQKRDEEAYLDPAKAQEEKEKGNALFKAADYPGAVKAYTEAIRRNPKEPVFYSNRASAYCKLGEFKLAERDCDEALKLDPKFGKALVRRAGILYYGKEYHKALEAYQHALELDPENEEIKDGIMQTVRAMNETQGDKERLAKAMADPEIQSILSDPMMQTILENMKTDPKAAQSYMRDPTIVARIQKLVAAGVLQVPRPGPPRPGAVPALWRAPS